MNFSRAEKEQLAIADEILGRAGIKYEVKPGSKHKKLLVGGTQFSIASSPSNHRSLVTWKTCMQRAVRMANGQPICR